MVQWLDSGNPRIFMVCKCFGYQWRFALDFLQRLRSVAQGRCSIFLLQNCWSAAWTEAEVYLRSSECVTGGPAGRMANMMGLYGISPSKIQDGSWTSFNHFKHGWAAPELWIFWMGIHIVHGKIVRPMDGLPTILCSLGLGPNPWRIAISDVFSLATEN